ncbi:AT-hook motif nuclear-localized protein 17 [Daucus carota subsp. sativus]|uniref:AT-hook motif nuclear-localized protein 17 n=1 Tax=Daucus carota subsp. sativus TaxID=79200 RepID=UPI003083108D
MAKRISPFYVLIDYKRTCMRALLARLFLHPIPSPFTMNNSRNSSSVFVPQGSSERGPSKPRGRPPGSKNKPKESKRETMGMKPVTLEVPAGVDIITWVTNFANSNQVCVTVTAGFGHVSLAVLSNVLSQAPVRQYKEYLTVNNFSGTYVLSPLTQATPSFFNAALSRMNGELIGGAASRMVTMGRVVLSAYVFRNPHVFTVGVAEFH